MSQIPPELTAARERFLDLVKDLRPELHRYCSRLVGSAIDGEDVVQESLAKAYYAMSMSPECPPLRPWLLRIAHNTAIDFLRRYERRFVEPVAEVPDDAATEPDVEHPQAIRLALSSFLALPVLQRSAVILKDVLDSSLEEIAQTLGTTVPAVKAALVRARRTLEAQPVPDIVPWRDRPETSPRERAQLERYVALFNAKDWPGLQDLLAEECQLDLVSKSARRGKPQITPYYGNYAKDDARLGLGEAEGRTVIGVYRPASATRPSYVVTIDWRGDRVDFIRDYRYVPYLMAELAFEPAS
ncbi:MAG TPA: sigma-70 family RNA polymerase sigma factor [Kofleriaceae bacterium]|nr:sigma-70 family RNA polymerase sigma factor [Kofleriaceae bacterium]